GRLLGPLVDRLQPGYDPPAMVAEVEDGEALQIGDGAVVVHTPGHTPGHISVILPSQRVLIVGDAAGCLLGRVGMPLGMYTEDLDLARDSIRKLAELDFDTACFGHGTAYLRGGARAAFRRLVDRLASRDSRANALRRRPPARD